MNKRVLKRHWLRNLIAILLVLGIFFRFYNLERKVYWYDETMTSLRISGYTQTELVQQVFDGGPISVEQLLGQYQYPNRTKNLTDTLNALAGNPEHSPLYYWMARFWLQIFGNSIVTIRALSAVISLLAIPCVYWLCRELFNSSVTAWVGAAIISISPFHVLYGQEAREYSLWTVTILFSCAALLRAKRLNNWSSWVIYGLSVALGLYAHPFSGFVLLGHGIYILLTATRRWGKQLGAFLLSSIVGFLLFVPWMVIVIANFSKFLDNTASVTVSRSGFLPLFWGLNLSRIFLDFNQGTSPFSPLHYLAALLAIYALYHLYRHTPLETWLFIITLIGVTGTAIIAPDLILGGRRSSITRYAIPCYLGIQIAVAYLISSKCLGVNCFRDREIGRGGEGETRIKRDKQILGLSTTGNYQRWQYVAIVLIISGVLSCLVSSQIPVWWHKSYAKSRYNPQIVRLVNQTEQPLLISDEIPGRILSLCHWLKPNVQLQLVVEPNIPEIADGFKNVFLYRPSETLKQGIEEKYNSKLEPAYKSWLWKLEKTG
ncbi:MAG: phospholipid carrier-dependent glycosyltransferase [Symploca sp. SIO3C6]|nr:phospholipid carrier-dependent glycosyltransferase [Symploca sp. SIO3C6]